MTTEEDRISRAARIIHEDACIDCDPDRPVRCTDAARSLADAGMLATPEHDLSVDIETTATGQWCIVKRSGITVFEGVSLEALLTTEARRQADR